MKKTLACIVTGLLFTLVTGIAQGEESYTLEDNYIEGQSHNLDLKQSHVVPTKVVDQGHLYLEGMGFDPPANVQKTILPQVSDRCDWCGEGYTEEEIERIIQQVNEIKPAAGK